MNSRLPFKKLEQAMKEVAHRLPQQIGTEVVNFSRANFRKQGWQGDAFQPWAARRGNTRKGRAILVQSGRLRRSVRITRVTKDYVIVGSDVPYARAHNEGFAGTVAVRGHTRARYSSYRAGTGKYTSKGKERTRKVSYVSGRHQVKPHMRRMKIKRRQFLGDSQHLRRNVRNLVAIEVLRAAKRI